MCPYIAYFVLGVLEGDIIKELIQYYYNMHDINLQKQDYEYHFIYDGYEYFFSSLVRNENEIYEIEKLISANDHFDQIVPNINKQLITLIYNRKYLLVKRKKQTTDIEKSLFNCFFGQKLYSGDIYSINHSNWGFLWSKKVDYIEYQLLHFDGKYPLLERSTHYFIGMAENAISYLNIATENSAAQDNELVISHNRILDESLDTPQNIIVDYIDRDIAEYLRYLFMTKKYNFDKIYRLLTSLNLSSLHCKRIYARLFFPTTYFDLFNGIIYLKTDETKVMEILKRVEEYEDYINKVYDILFRIKKIPKITWI